MPGSYADARSWVWTPSLALPLLTACTGLSKANLCIVYGCFARSQRKSSTLRAICTKSPKSPSLPSPASERMFHVKHSISRRIFSFAFEHIIICLFSLLFIQIIVSLVLLILFSMDYSSGNLIIKFIYIGAIYALIKANSFSREFLGGVSTTISQNVNNFFKK